MSKAEELLDIANKTNLADDFVKAGNHLVIEKKYTLAGEAFENAGHIHLINNRKYEGACLFVKAVDYYDKDKKYNVARDLLNVAITIYLEDGKLSTAAKQLEKLGEVYYNNKQIPLAIESYKKSCKWYCLDNSKDTGYGILYKAVELAINSEQYAEAISLLTQIDKHYESNQIAELKRKKVFLEISILKLYSLDECEPYLLTQECYKSTREYELISNLIESLDRRDKQQFGKSMFIYLS